MNREKMFKHGSINIILIVTVLIIFILSNMSVLADKNSASDFYFRLEGNNGEEARMSGTTRLTGAYYPVNNTVDGNYVIYSTAAKHTGQTGVEVYDSKLGKSVEFNVSLTTAYGTDALPATFDTTKCYKFQFYAKVNKGEFKLILIRNETWETAMTMASPINKPEWTAYEFTMGPAGTKGVDYTYNDYFKNQCLFFRFSATTASKMYLDDIRFTEVNTYDLVKNGDFEYLSSEGIAINNPNWEVGDGTTAVLTPEAKYKDDYGVHIDGVGDVEFSYNSDSFDKTKKYIIGFYGKALNGNFEMNVLNSSDSPLLSSSFPIETEKYYRLIIGPKGSKNVHMTYDPGLITDNKITLQFKRNGGSGTLNLDSVSCTETSDDKLVFKANTISFTYEGSSTSPNIKLEEGKILNVALKLSNSTILEKKIEVIAALYNAVGMLEEYNSSGIITIPSFTANQTAELKYSLPENVSGKKVKIFIWDGIVGQHTLLKEATLPGEYELGTMLSQSLAEDITEQISISKTPVIEDGVVKIEVTTPKGQGKVVNLVVKKDTDSSVVYFDEKISGADGKALFEFLLDDMVLKNDCTAYFGSEDVLKNSVPFFYYTDNQKIEIITEVNSISFESTIASEANKKVLRYSGLDFTLFAQLSDEGQKAVSGKIDSNKPVGGYNADTLKKAFNDYSVTTFINKKSKLSLTEFKDAFTTYAQNHFNGFDKNDWIYEKLKNSEYQSQDAIQSRLIELSALYNVNNAAYAILPEVLEQYESGLKLNLCKHYSQYKAMDLNSDIKNEISKDFALLASATPSESSESLRASFDEAFENKYRAPETNTGGGYKSGGTSTIHIDNMQEVMKDAKPSFVMKFNDLSGFEWATESINELYIKGILSGENENEFKPDHSITREEFVKLLVKAMGISLVNEESGFTDVDNTKWYYPYVATAKKAHIVNGISEDTFGVGNTITRQDMAVMIYRALQAVNKISKTDTVITFIDKNEIDDYALEGISAMSEYGIIKGNNDNTFESKKIASRAESAVMIYRLYQFSNKAEGKNEEN